MIGGVIEDQEYKVFEIWEWKDNNWTLLQENPASMPYRKRVGTGYDPIRDRVIIYGGKDEYDYRDELWEWDGKEWTEVTHSEPWPSFMTDPDLVFNSDIEKLVLFGKTIDYQPMEMWYWDGVVWEKQESLSSIPSRRSSIELAYDPIRSVVVIYGGNQFLEDTWEWDGEDWHQIETPHSPGSRFSYAATYNPNSQSVMLFGGKVNGGEECSDTWFFDGADWTGFEPDPMYPPDVVCMDMAYNPIEQISVFYGGKNSNQKRTHTFEWDGLVWTDIETDTNPGKIDSHCMAYIGALEGVVLYGGYTGQYGNEISDRMWIYKTRTWTELNPVVKPGPRTNFGMAYDSLRDYIVLFGGVVAVDDWDVTYSTETWEFNGVNWEQRLPEHHPPHFVGGMAFDSCRGVTVLFNDDGTARDGTWEYDGFDWTKIEPATTVPIRRGGSGFVFDESRCRLVMHGGISNLEPGYDETWEWDGYDWYLIDPDGPLGHYGAMTYDIFRKCCVFNCGSSWDYTVETFEYRHSNPDICPQMGVTINLSQSMFHSGDLFSCSVDVCNNTGDTITNYPLAVLLDVYGNFYWGPSFTEEFDSFLTQHTTFPEGITEVEVLPEFPWPPDVGRADGIIFYAALVDPAIHNLIGHMDSVVFGWE